MRPDLGAQRRAEGAESDPTLLLLGLAAALARVARAAAREAPPEARAEPRPPETDPTALALLGLLSLHRRAERWRRHHAAAGDAARRASPEAPPPPGPILR